MLNLRKNLWIVVVLLLSLSAVGLMRAAPVRAGITPTPTPAPTDTPTPTLAPTDTPVPTSTSTPVVPPRPENTPTLTPTDAPVPGPQATPMPTGTPTPFPLLPHTGDRISALPPALFLGGMLLFVLAVAYLARRRAR